VDPAPTPPALRMRAVRKAFGAVQALSGVDFEVHAGEVHALIGENGAGKSTLMKILAGAMAPDDGELELDGAPYRPAGPQDALARGVSMIYQELNLASDLSIERNVLLGREPRRFGLADQRAMRAQVTQALAALGHAELHPGRLVAALGPGERQVVEIARALVGDLKVLVLDEPTSSLTRDDAARLFAVVRRLRDRGVAVIYISHFLEEVAAVADRYTVLRDGQSVASGPVAGTAPATMVAQMAGRALEEFFPRVPHQAGAVALELKALAGARLPRAASLELRRGEILGIAGLVGAGRTEMLRAIQGLDPVRGGAIRCSGRTGLLSEDRKGEGLALPLSIAVNTTLGRMQTVSRRGFVVPRLLREKTAHWIERLGIRAAGPFQPVADLSGGNQQKVALARLLHHDVDVLLLDEPTRGVDVGSKVEIYLLLGELAAQGKAILMVSSYLPELLGVCDRIAVMHRGALGPARPAAEWSEHSLLQAATSGEAA